MKIILATGIYPPELGGPATYTQGLALALQKLGHQITVVTYGRKADQRPDDFKVHYVPRNGGSLWRYVRYAWKVFCLARHADLVYAQGPVSEGFPATLGAKLAGRPTVVKVVGDYAWEMAQQQPSANQTPVVLVDEFLKQRHGGKIGIYEWIERWTVRQARRVIVPGKYLATVVARWGVPEERIVVVQNAVKPFPLTADRESERQLLGVMNQTIVLYAGRAVRWKGISELINWWQDLPNTFVLVIAGDGPELENWKRLARHTGVEGRVRFLGAIQRPILARWLAAADCLVLPSAYEGYPHVVAEGAMFGVPCLVSDQAGNPETKQSFGDLVTVLPYLNRPAWMGALAQIRTSSQSTQMGDSSNQWTHTDMVETTLEILNQAHAMNYGQRQRVVMLSYDRELLDARSAVFERVSSLASGGLGISAVVLARLEQDARVAFPLFQSRGFSGPSVGRWFRALWWGIKEAKRLPGQTVITAQDPFVAGLLGYIISRWTNTPLEIQEHGDFYSGWWVRESWKNRALSWFGRFILKRAERVRAVSARVREHLIQIGVAPEKIEIISVAQDLSAARIAWAETGGAPQLRLAGSSFKIVAPCRFVHQKGLDVLLQAAVILHGRGMMFELNLIGNGSLERELKSEIERLRLTECVKILPWRGQAKVWDGADLFVLASRYEGWARIIVEAMAAGVPIVATDVGCVGSFFRPQIDGRVVEVNNPTALAEAIAEQIEEPERPEAMRQAALKHADYFPTQEVLHEKQRAGWRSLLLQNAKCQMPNDECGTKNTHHPRWDLWVASLIIFIILSRAASVVLFHNSLLNPEWGFLTLVDRWLHGFGYSFAGELGCASAYRSPGFLFFLTALYSIFSPTNTWAQAIVQNIIAGAAIWLVYLVGRRLVGKRAALVGGFLMAAYPYTFYHYTQFYHTFLSSFFLLLLVWFMLKLADKKLWRYAFGAGLSVGCLAYVQGTILPATPLIVAWLLYKWWPSWKRTMIAAVIMALCSVGLIAPWTYRNWTVFHHFVPLTTDLGHALFKANNEVIYELTKRGWPQEIVDEVTVSSTDPNYKQYRLPPELEEEFKRDGVFSESIYWTAWHPKEPVGRITSCTDRGSLDEYEFSKYWMGLTKTWLKENWWTDGLKLQALKLKTFWQPSLFPSVKTGAPWSFAGSPLKVWLARNAVTAASAVVIFGGWLGILFALRRRDKNVWLPLSIIIVYTLLHTLIAGYTKYRIPLDNLMAVYAGWVLIALWDKFRGTKKNRNRV
jgi:glycosyltransferase involved in cell wall biosynthesis/4-amino-4-deoxy-L-arabinose transferase-like glycosyltransferase